MDAADSTVLWRLFRKGAATTDRSHAVILPGGPPHTLAFFANDDMDRVENYATDGPGAVSRGRDQAVAAR